MNEVWQRTGKIDKCSDADEHLMDADYLETDSGELFERVRDPTNAHRLEAAWDLINSAGLAGGGYPHEDSGPPIKRFVNHVQNGCYPPPHVMLDIADAYKRYMDARGDKTLDEVLLETPSKRSNRPAYRERNQPIFDRFAFMLAIEPGRAKREGRKKRSHVDLAEEFIESYQSRYSSQQEVSDAHNQKKGTFLDDPESFIKAFNRSR